MEQQQAMVSGRAVVWRGEEELLRHLEEQERSGFTIKEYCEVTDIVEQNFYSWVKKYRPRPEEPAGFTAIEVVAKVSLNQGKMFFISASLSGKNDKATCQGSTMGRRKFR